jgi:hypothetical protein
MLCAAEIVDAVTLEPVIQDIKVRAEGLKQEPRVNRSGFHYWLEEGGAQPQRISVDASDASYADGESAPPVPPRKSVRIELAPRASYAFPPGATALRGTLRVSRFGEPEAVPGASVTLQWFDTGWVDAPITVTSDERGDFAAPLRLAPKDEPRLVNGRIAVRLRVERDGVTRTTDEISMPAGKVTPAAQPFIWDDLHP